MLWPSIGHSSSFTSDMHVYGHKIPISKTRAVPPDTECAVHQQKETREIQTPRITGVFALCWEEVKADLWWQQWHTWVTVCSTTLLKEGSGQAFRRWSLPLLAKRQNCSHFICFFFNSESFCGNLTFLNTTRFRITIVHIMQWLEEVHHYIYLSRNSNPTAWNGIGTEGRPEYTVEELLLFISCYFFTTFQGEMSFLLHYI